MRVISSAVQKAPKVFIFEASVDSSFITGFRFVDSEDNGTSLQVTMKNGRSYFYGGVPNEVFAKILTSDSIGKAYNETIKNIYPYVEG